MNEILGVGNIQFVHSNFSSKNDVALLKNSAFRELQIFIELIFRFIFQFIIFILRESSKRFLLLSYFLRFLGNQQLSLARIYCSITF